MWQLLSALWPASQLWWGSGEPGLHGVSTSWPPAGHGAHPGVCLRMTRRAGGIFILPGLMLSDSDLLGLVVHQAASF